MSFGNSRKDSFIKRIPTEDIVSSKLANRSKFNFSFFDSSQDAGDDFEDLEKEDLCKLANKIKFFSKSPLSYWQHQRCGGGGLKVLEIYGDFPKKSDFSHPAHVPHDVLWARFRLEGAFRLVGFVIPNSLDRECQTEKDNRTTFLFDINTFYVVFLDKNHRFYKT